MARQAKSNDLPPIIEAYQQWIAKCLIADGSLFSERELWTSENVEEVRAAFIDHPDVGEDSFWEKLRRQMQGASSGAKQLMAEMIWALLTFPCNVNAGTKRECIRTIWSQSGEALPDNLPALSNSVLDGIGSGGQGYLTGYWRELTFIIKLVVDLKGRAQPDRQRLLTNYEAFVQWIRGIPGGEIRQFRHMFRYVAFPDRVERIASNRDRHAILEQFKIAPENEMRKWGDDQVDQALLDLRQKLQDQYPGETLDFYEPPLKAKWKREEDDKLALELKETPEVNASAKSTDTTKGHRAYWWLNANPKIWDIRAAKVGHIENYTSHNKAGNKRQKYKHFEAVKPGDLVIGYVTSPDKEIVALCEITKGLHKTREGEVIEFKKIEHFKEPVTWTELQSAPALKNCEPIESNQGSLFALKEEEYEFIRSLIDDRNLALQETVQPFTKADALAGLFMPASQLDLMLARLKQKKALILQGPPGVGKTFVAKRLAYALMGQRDDRRVSMVQFHPSYGYEDFIQGFRPSRAGGLERRDGVFYDFARLARNDPDRDWFFIIDEINRGNLAKIFGELLMLMEADKRGPDNEIALTYSDKDERFYLPANLHVIGTMNTADRSLALVDYALRRRFAFVTLEPAVQTAAFGDWMLAAGASKALLDRIRSGVGVLNAAIDKERDLGRRFFIGHSFFCPNGQKPDENWYREVIQTEIKPLLEEYFDSNDRVENLIAQVLK